MTWVRGGTSVSITTTGYPLKTDWGQKQNRIRMENGDVDVYDRGKLEVFYTFTIRLTQSTFAALQTFIRDTLAYRYNTFTLTPDSGVDLGLGDGVAITARYWDSNLVQEWVGYNQFDFELTVRLEWT